MTADPDDAVGLALAMIGHGRDVLELGCAAGEVTRRLTETRGCRVTAVEVVPDDAERARPHCRTLVVGDLESPATLDAIGGQYDVILAGDVLEHLRRPDLLLTRLQSRLKPSGSWVISVPNVAHWSVRKELLLGRFDYTPRGIMDASHLRWFTVRTLSALLERCGYRIVRRDAVYTLPMQDALHLRGLARALRRTRRAPGLFGYQIVVEARVAER
jgi:2-polyprenyl-3-methyl-5-hydroxy-6-metoxy-1,4-benzoquinol methylase